MGHCSALVIFFCLAVPGVAQVSLTEPRYYKDGHDRVHDYVFRTYTDPARIGWLLFDSAVDNWSQAPHEWDRSSEGYMYRVASGWGRRIVRNTAQLGLETVLQEDSRYRTSGERRFGRRFFHAVNHSVLAYKPDGSVEPMYGRMAAGVIASATSSTWHPHSIAPVSLLGGMGQSAIDRAGNNLLSEFEPELRNFGRRVWNNLVRK
jgi:hypothetical protein